MRRWAAVLAVMIVLSGCGHQVTGLNLPGGGNNIVPSGQTLLRFETAATPDFGNYTYLIVINATGDGALPIANGSNSNYKEWSFAIIVNGGPGYVNPPLFRQYYADPSAAGAVNHRDFTPATGTVFFSLLPSNGSVNGFDVRFDRCILDFPSPINNTGAPTPPPSPHPVGSSCPPFFYLASAQWTMNIFTADNTLTAVDSLGNGPFDTSYRGFLLDTTASINDQVYRKPIGTNEPQSPSAQIVGLEAFSQP